MNNSRHPSCFIASFSNLLQKRELQIDDDLLFGLSSSFDFQYNYANLPLSGPTHTFTGTNFNAFSNLASKLNMEYKIEFSSKELILDKLSETIKQYSIVIVEVSIKALLAYYSDQQLDSLMSMITEGESNHVINVVDICDSYVHVYDNFHEGIQKLNKEILVNAMFPVEKAILTARGRIHCFQFAAEYSEPAFTDYMSSIYHSSYRFLYGNNPNTGLRALHQFRINFPIMIENSQENDKQRSVQLFYYFCISAGGGSFFRKHYLRFLKKIAEKYEITDELAIIIAKYKTLHNKWRSFAITVQKSANSSEHNTETLLGMLDEIIHMEESGNHALLSFSLTHKKETQFLKFINHASSTLDIKSITSYLNLIGYEYQYKATNEKTDIDADFEHYGHCIYVLEKKKSELVHYHPALITDSKDQQRYDYFIIFN